MALNRPGKLTGLIAVKRASIVGVNRIRVVHMDTEQESSRIAAT
jgi:hypothetical protein